MNEKRWDNLAKEYHKLVISPFQSQVNNPLKKHLKEIPHKENKIVAEVGCGRFELGEFLSKRFKEVFAYDFSEKMINLAKEKNNFPNTQIKLLDTTKIQFKEKLDVVISVNSLIMPSFNEIKTSLKNIYNGLKNNGKFFIIVPSMESILYEGLLILNKKLDNQPEKIAITSTKRIHENRKYDYLLGYYKEMPDIQKFFYEHEITYFLEKTGFKKIMIEKVEYPWNKKVSDYEQFPNEKPLWDWFVMCEK